MDSHLLGQAIEYHGPDLLRQLTIEEQPFPKTVVDHLHKCRPQSPEIKDDELMNKVRNFIAKKSDMLFKPGSDNVQVINNSLEGEDNYGKMPPIETFMGLPSGAARKHFFNSLEKKDIVIGVVSSIMESGLIVTLLCLDSGKSRDIDELKITAFCPNKELPRLFPNQSAVEAFQIKDKIRGIVLSVNPETEKINISLLDRAVPDDVPKIKLGLISEEEFPVQYRRKLHVRGLTFDELLHSIIGFNNCNSVPYLLGTLQQKEEISLMRGLHKFKVPEKEYSENMRKIQSQKWAHQSVASGIKYFKAGKHMEAMQELNRALQIDTNNVEALVARGALYANNESYHKAIQDFEDALAVNVNHSNARKYLFETLLAVAREKEDRGVDLEEAEYYYKKALSIQPESLEARESLRCLHTKKEKQGQHKRKSSHDSNTCSTPKSQRGYLLKKDKDNRGSSLQRRNSNTSSSSSIKCQSHTDSTQQKRSSMASHAPEKFQEDLMTSTSQSDSFLDKTTETLKKLIKEDKKDGKKRKRKSTDKDDLSRRAKKKRRESHGSKSNDSSFEELHKKEERGNQRELKSDQKSLELSEDHSGRSMIPNTQRKFTDLPSRDSGLSQRLSFFSTDMQQRGLRIPGLEDSESDNEIDMYESSNQKRLLPDSTQKRTDHLGYENMQFEENDQYLEFHSPQETGTDDRKSESKEIAKTSHKQDFIQSRSQRQISQDRYRDKEDDAFKMVKKDSAVEKDIDFNAKGALLRSSEIRSSGHTKTCIMAGHVEGKKPLETSTKASNRRLFVDIPRQLKKVIKKDAQNFTQKTMGDNLEKEAQQVTVDKEFRDDEVMINIPEQATKMFSDQTNQSSQDLEKGDSKIDADDHKDIAIQEKDDRKGTSLDLLQKRLSIDKDKNENRTGRYEEISSTKIRDIRRNRSSGSRSIRRSHSRSPGRSVRRSYSRSPGRSVRRSHSRSPGRSVRRSHSRSPGRSFHRLLRSSGKSNKLYRSDGNESRSHRRLFQSSHSRHSEASSRRSPYHEIYFPRFKHQESRKHYTGLEVSPYKDEILGYRGRRRARGRWYREGFNLRIDYSERVRKKISLDRFIAKKNLEIKRRLHRSEKRNLSQKMDKRQDDRCIIDMERCPINTSIRDERIKSQHRGSDKRSPINQPAFGKEYFGADCIPSDKLDKLASPDMNSADDKSSNEIHSLKQLQHKVKYSGQRRPGKERIKSKHLSPFKRNVASSEIPLVTVDLKSKWDSPKRKSRWGTPDQYSIGMGLELPLIFANSWKGESGSSVIESKLSVHESAAVPKKEKIHFEGRKGENDTFSSPFKKMSPHHLKVDIEENKCDIGRRNAGDVNIQRLSDRDLEDSRDGIYRQPKMSPDLIDDRILSISSQKGKSYQRENIISSQNTGQEILLYVTRDEKDGTDESRRQEKGSIDDMYDVKQKIGEHDMKGRQRDNTDFNDAVSSPGGSKFAQPELIGSYYNQVSSEHLHPNSTSAPKNFPDLIKNTKSLTGTTYSRAESPQQRRSRTRSDRHVERQREMLKRHLKRIERPSSTHTWLGAKGFTKHFGFKSFEPSYKRFRSASFSFSFAREGMNKKFAATENRKERSRSKQLKLETAPRQKMKTRHGQRSSTTRSASSSSASSSTIASHSSVGIKDSFTDEKSTSFASKSDMTTGKLQTEDSKAQSKPESKGTTETTDKTNKKRKESLDELVKFLNQLKERKKEQLKAEGKIKGKNSENIP